MDQLNGILTDDEDIIELINIIDHPRAPRQFRNRENQFEKWNDVEFLTRFRLSKNTIRFILENIREQISSATERNYAISAEEMLLVTLRFYATGSFLQVCGDFLGISKATTCRIIHKVSRAIAGLNENFITMPITEAQMRTTSEEFGLISRFPRCIGALDCTHIKIQFPGGPEPEIYRNRKGFFSKNIQVICDTNLKIQNIVCRWAGSVHDSTIWNNCRVRRDFENGLYRNYLLVGDSGYGVRPFLITPLANPINPAQHLFNEAQIRTRNPVERCFGVWKRRFPILSLGIRVNIQKVEAIIVATAVLHNIACLRHEELPPVDDQQQNAINFVNEVFVENIGDHRLVGNNAVRLELINYFNGLL